ncbi:MAG: hypothetical protein KUG76_06745 [Gammaproteobacteria bacterium]|nr:hypothetical protein [Gammaproteobacteria bacterium]
MAYHAEAVVETGVEAHSHSHVQVKAKIETMIEGAHLSKHKVSDALASYHGFLEPGLSYVHSFLFVETYIETGANAQAAATNSGNTEGLVGIEKPMILKWLMSELISSL